LSVCQGLARIKKAKAHGRNAMGFLPVSLDDLHRTQYCQNPEKSCRSQQCPLSQRIRAGVLLSPHATFKTTHWKPEQ
jgi:hypothetical protein